MRHDIISDVFSTIKNAESLGKKECVVPASKLIKAILKVMQDHGYIKEFGFIEDGKGGKFKIKLQGSINDCNAIRPRFSTTVDEIIKFEKRFLPATGTGILIITTSQGVMDHAKAKKLRTGGKLLGYVY